MCGITAISANKEALSFLLQGLEKLEYRGYDSAGITTIEGNHVFTKKAKGRLQNLKDLLKDENVFMFIDKIKEKINSILSRN